MNIKSSVDNKSPKQFYNENASSPARNPSKKKSTQRKREIELENNALIQKMLKIMQRGSRSSSTSPSGKRPVVLKQPQGFQNIQPNTQFFPTGGILVSPQYNQQQLQDGLLQIQGINQQMRTSSANYYPYDQITQNSQSQSTSLQINQNASSQMIYSQQASPSKVGSLNFQKRKKDIDHINSTNRQLLKALQNVKATVNREELRNHEKRIQKLKQHIGQVRYGSPMNFLFPKVENENHNFHSSQFVFVKNPSLINLRGSQSQLKQYSRDNLNMTQQNFMSSKLDARPITEKTSVRRLRNNFKMNQSADLSNLNPLNQYIQVQRQNPQQQMNFMGQQLLSNNLIGEENLKEVTQSQDEFGTSRNSTTNLNVAATGAIDEQIRAKKKVTQKFSQSSYNNLRAVTPQAIQKNNIIYQFDPNSQNPNVLSQPQRKIKQRQLRQKTAQSQIRFNKKDLQIISSYQPNLLGHQFANLNITQNYQQQVQNLSTKNVQSTKNPFQPDKFVKQQTSQKQHLLFQNMINTPKTQINKNYTKINREAQIINTNSQINPQFLNNLQESSIKLIEQPKININKAEESPDKQDSAKAKIEFYNNINSESQIPNSEMVQRQIYQSPQFLSERVSKDQGSPINKQKLNFDTANVEVASKNLNPFQIPNNNINKNPVIQTDSTKQNSQKFIRTNTKYVSSEKEEKVQQTSYDSQKSPTHLSINSFSQDKNIMIQPNLPQNQKQMNVIQKDNEFPKKSLQQIVKEQKVGANQINLSSQQKDFVDKANSLVKTYKVVNAIKDQKDKKEKAERKAQEFIDILKKKINDRKILLKKIESEDEGHQIAKNFFGQIMNMAQKQEQEGSLSIRYSNDSFDMGDQEDVLIPHIQDNEAFQKYLQGNKKIEKQILQEEQQEQKIIEKAQKILNVIKDQFLKEKIEKKVNKFVFILKEKVIENKQKQVVRRMFAKKLSKAVQDKNGQQQNPKEIANQFISNLKGNNQSVQKSANQLLNKLKQNHNSQLSIKEQFGLLSHNARQIVIQFFKVVWRRVNVKKLVKQFVNILKVEVKTQGIKRFNKMAIKIQRMQQNKQMMSRIIGLHVRSSKNLSEGLESLSIEPREEERSFQTPQKHSNFRELQIKSYSQQIIQNRIKTFENEKVFLSRMRDELKSSNSRNDQEISDEQRAKLNAASFIVALKDKSSIKKSAMKLVKLFVIILKRKLKEKQEAAEKANKQKQKMKVEMERMTTVFSFSSKKRKGQDLFGLKHVISLEVLNNIFKEFRRMLCYMLLRDKNKRNSKIFMLYLALEFKQRVLLLLQRDMKINMGKRDEENAKYKNIQSFLFINNLKNKYIQLKGKLKYQEYMQRMIYFYKRISNQKAKFRYQISQSSNKYQVIKFFICKLFQMKSYQEYIRSNPFKFNVLYLRDVKWFIASLFQNKRDLIGRPRNIFKIKGYKPSIQRVKLFIAKLFQIKMYKSQGLPKSKNLSSGGKVNLKQLKAVNKFGNSLRQIKNQSANDGLILKPDIQTKISKEFKQLFVQFFQLNQKQRNSRFFVLNFGRKFNQRLIDILRAHYKLICSMKNENENYKKRVQQFVIINEIKLRLQAQSGLNKVKFWMMVLRNKVRRNKNIQAQIQQFNHISDLQSKLKMMRYTIAKVFQQKGLTTRWIYNPFIDCFNKKKFIRYFIANLFQNQHNILGRPINIFKKFAKPSERQIRYYIAKLFQVKVRYYSQKSQQPQNDKLTRIKSVGKQTKSIRSIVKVIKMSPKIPSQFNVAQIKDESLWKELSIKTAQFIAKVFQLSAKKRQSVINVLYLGQSYRNSIWETLDNYVYEQIDKKGDRQLINNLKALVLINQLRNKNLKRKGQLKHKEYINRLRFYGRRTLNNRQMIHFKLNNAHTEQDKIKVIRQFMAFLFQQKTYSESVRFNPFVFNYLTKFEIKTFIADLFQNNRDLIGRPRNVFKDIRPPSQMKVKRFVAQQFQIKKYARLSNKFYMLLRRMRVQRILQRFAKILREKLNNLKLRQNDIASQMMKMLNLQFQNQNSQASSRMATAHHQVKTGSDYDFDDQHSFVQKEKNKKEVIEESMSIGQTSSEDASLIKQEFLKKEEDDEVNSLIGEDFCSPEEKELYKKMLKDTKQHIQQSSNQLKRKVSMYKNQMQNSLIKNFKSKIKDEQDSIEKQTTQQKPTENTSSEGNLKMLALALKQAKQQQQQQLQQDEQKQQDLQQQQNMQKHAMNFLGAIHKQQEEHKKTEENVQKFVSHFKFQKNEGRAKIIIEDDESI